MKISWFCLAAWQQKTEQQQNKFKHKNKKGNICFLELESQENFKQNCVFVSSIFYITFVLRWLSCQIKISTMEFHDNDDSESDEATIPWLRLDTLPPEIFLHICSFLSAKFVISVLSRVCKKFKALIESDTTWKMRIFRRWPKKYPLIPSIEDIDWKAACIAREEQHHLWEDSLNNMRKFHFYGAHFGSVNVVKLIEEGMKCLSGGRDGYVKLWNLDPTHLINQPFNTDFVDIPSSLINASHHSNAWLWDITYDSVNKHIYTGGFDSNIKVWDFEQPSEPLMSYGLSSPILCLAYNKGQLASGCYGRIVTVFDTREKQQPIYKHTQHKSSVLCIFTDDKYVISGSEDKSVIVFDKVAGEVFKKIEFEWFPLSMSYADGQLIVGDVNNSIHVIDPSHGNFDLLHTFPTGHTKKVTGVQHSLGSVITCSTDKTIRILEPHVDPETIAIIESSNEVARISLCNNILACANVDDSISVWIPGDVFQ